MALIDDVKVVCDRLAGAGWRDLLRRHGLDIGAPDLAAELARNLTGIDRAVPGFQDFHPDAVRGVEPGVPCMSLLYHAFASPAVHLSQDGTPVSDPHAYPTLDDLDIIENYIYARANKGLTDFPGAVVAIFAYQYRTGHRSPHGLYADLAFSRTGVARVGTAPVHYDPVRRSFWGQPEDGGDAVCAMAARYAAFLAIPRRLSPNDAILGGIIGVMDTSRTFLVPVHKLFPGPDSLAGRNLSLSFAEFHQNEKLRRVHTHGDIPPLPGFDVNLPPFVRDSVNMPGEMLELRRAGNGSVLIVPVPHPSLVRSGTQRRTTTSRDEIIRFVVPAANESNRFWTSHAIPPTRPRPGCARVRQHPPSCHDGCRRLTNDDRSEHPAGGRVPRAAEGWRIRGGPLHRRHLRRLCQRGRKRLAGYGRKGQPHTPRLLLGDGAGLLPPDGPTHHLRVGTEPGRGHPQSIRPRQPRTIGPGRTPANPSLPRPTSSAAAFTPGGPDDDRRDRHHHSRAAGGPIAPGSCGPGRVRELPVGRSLQRLPARLGHLTGSRRARHLSYGVRAGKPFPRRCQALRGTQLLLAGGGARRHAHLWTAGVPHRATTARRRAWSAPTPPLVQGGQLPSRHGWDGEFGPFFEDVGGQTVRQLCQQGPLRLCQQRLAWRDSGWLRF